MRTLNKPLVGGLLTGLVLMGCSAFFSYISATRLIQTSRWVDRTHTTLTLESELLARLNEAENGMFGFIITGNPDFLKDPYGKATNRIDAIIAQLRFALRDDPAQLRKLEGVQGLAERRLQQITQRIELRAGAGFDPAADLIKSGEAKALMDRLRMRVGEMIQNEEAHLREGERKAVLGANSAIACDIGFGLFSALLLTTISLFLLKENAGRKERELQLRQARDQLELRVVQRTAELELTNAKLQAEISQHKQSAAALMESQSKLRQMAAVLEDKNKELEMIVYIASHDLRSPLVNIQGYSRELATACKQVTSRLLDENDSCTDLEPLLREEVPEAIQYIEASVTRMDALLSGFLRFSRLGHEALNIHTLDVRQMLHSILQTMRFQIQEAGACVCVQDLPSCLGDPVQTGQVFSNLIDNALKYRDPQRPLEIQISGHLEDGRAVYAVKDTGLGIPPDQQAKAFEIFQRLNPERAPGEGLGLTIARKILQRQNGKIWLESAQGKGSTFFVALPHT